MDVAVGWSLRNFHVFKTHFPTQGLSHMQALSYEIIIGKQPARYSLVAWKTNHRLHSPLKEDNEITLLIFLTIWCPGIHRREVRE